MPTRLNQLRTPLYHTRILPRWIQAQVDRRVRGGPGQFLRHPSAKAAETRVLGYATTHKNSLNHADVVCADLAALPSPYGFRLSRRPVSCLLYTSPSPRDGL